MLQQKEIKQHKRNKVSKYIYIEQKKIKNK